MTTNQIHCDMSELLAVLPIQARMTGVAHAVPTALVRK